MYQQIIPWLSYFLGENCEGYEAFMEYPINGISLNSTCPSSIPDVTITQNNNTLSTTTQGNSYQWYLNGEPILGETNDSLQVSGNLSGFYQLLVYFDYGCQYSNNIAQVAELEKTTLNIFPNPASNFIEIRGLPLIDYSFTILNLQGQLVQAGTLSVENSTILLNELPKGSYFLQLNGVSFMVLIKR
jgi:hypothetical protein